MEKQLQPQKKPLTRFGEFELLKAMAILGLPAVHLMEEAVEYGYASAGLSSFARAVIVLCAFGPSVFMLCMGFGIGGGRTSAKSIRKNGIQFLLIGLLLNILRWLIPGILQTLIIKTPLIQDIDFSLQSDIYYFVGLYFIFFSFLRQWKVQTSGVIMISIIMLTVNTLLTPLTGKYIKNEILAAVLGNFVYVDETSCFPLLSWAIFPSVGVLLGEVLKKSDEARRENIMRRMLDFSAVLLGSFCVFLWNYDIDILKTLVSPANNYITDLPNVVLLLSLALFMVAMHYYLCKRIGASRFMGFMLRLSTFIIPFYLLQWIIIAWIFYGIRIAGAPKECFNLGIYLACVAAVTAVCLFITMKYGMKIMKLLLKITTFKKKKKNQKKEV